MIHIMKPEIFSLNYFKVDDSYPKRLWRLSKNLALRYDKNYWSFCFEFRDAILDYLAQNQQENRRFLKEQFVN